MSETYSATIDVAGLGEIKCIVQGHSQVANQWAGATVEEFIVDYDKCEFYWTHNDKPVDERDLSIEIDEERNLLEYLVDTAIIAGTYDEDELEPLL